MTAEAGEGSPFAGKVWLAPLTFGGNLPFRRLCVELGAEVTVSEMAVVKKLLKDRNSEFALLRSHQSEPFFGVQLADRHPDSLAEGARIAEAKGARFVDLNCGCPIDQMTRRGLGASLLQKPGRLARLVASMVAAVKVPVTVKLRLGWREGHENASALAKGCEEAGGESRSRVALDVTGTELAEPVHGLVLNVQLVTGTRSLAEHFFAPLLVRRLNDRPEGTTK